MTHFVVERAIDAVLLSTEDVSLCDTRGGKHGLRLASMWTDCTPDVRQFCLRTRAATKAMEENIVNASRIGVT